jgi:hypothetical protein
MTDRIEQLKQLQHGIDEYPAFPDDMDDEPECCEHEDYDVDILEGTARCWYCGHQWEQTKEEIEREIKAQREYDKMCEEWEKERRSIRYRLSALLMRVRSWLRPTPALLDDNEIPF